MKKIYEIPVCIVADVNAEAMIATSIGSDLEGTGNGGNTGDNGIVEGDVKAHNLWGEEW